jgi:hypothetical protein
MIGRATWRAPPLNMPSFWVTSRAGPIMLGLLRGGGHAAAGWTSTRRCRRPSHTGELGLVNPWCISLSRWESAHDGVDQLHHDDHHTWAPCGFRMLLVIWSPFITAILLLLAAGAHLVS